MSDFSDEMAAIALELLTEFGEAVTFTRTSRAAYDPSTSTAASSGTSVFTGYGFPEEYLNRDIDGDRIQAGDIRIYVNSVSTEPAPADVLTMNSTDYRVVRVRPYRTTGAPVLYELQVRV